MADAQTLKGAWSLTPDHPVDVFGEHEIVENCDEIIMLQIMCGQHMRPGAMTFSNAFDRDRVEHSYAEAALQAIFKTLNDVRLALELDRNKKDVTCNGEPFEVFIETLLRNERDSFIGPYDLGSTPETLAERVFMRNVEDNVVVDGYRFFIITKKGLGGVSFGDLFMRNIDEIESEYLRSVTQAVRKAARGESGDTGVSMMSYSGGDKASYGRSLGPNDKWRLLRNRTVWAKTADMLLNIGHFGSNADRVRDRIASRRDPYSKNPINPRYSLSPALFMNHAFSSIDAEQTTLSNYMVVANSFDRWQFPRHDLVLRVPTEDLTIDRIMNKMVPEYLARMAPGVMSQLMRQRRKGMDKRVLQRQRLAGAPNSVLPARDMVQRSLAFGEANDVDAFLGEEGIGSMIGDESMGGEYVDESLDACVGRLSIDAAQDDSDGYVAPVGSGATALPDGGKAFSDIVNMLQAVGCRDKTGKYFCVDVDALQREDFEDSSSLAARQMLESSDKSSSSSFHRVRFMGASLRSRLIELIQSGELTPEECRRAYLANQRTLMRAYEDSCTSKTSNIMMQGASIVGWAERRCEERDTKWMGVEEPIMDREMTIFGNMFARWMLCMEDSLFVTNLHLLALTAIFGSRDAYRHKLKMHFNLLMTGDNSTGKSFVTDLLDMCSIPGTISQQSSKTKNANFVDADHNDMIYRNEEIQPDAYRDKKRGGDDAAEATNKEFLTSMLYTKQVFYKGEDGSRAFRISVSQQISTLIGCTNLRHDEFSPAIRSRLSCVPVVAVRRENRQTQDMVGIEERLPVEKLVVKQGFIDEMQMDQFFQYHVEKLIGIHALRDITLGAFDAVMQVLQNYLRQCHAILVPIRTIERAGMIARKLVITHACHLLYSTPHSPYYKRDFEYRSLLALDPLLHDNEEIACFALELIKHEIVDRSAPHFVQLLKANYVHRRLCEIEKTDTTRDVDSLMNDIYLRPSTRVTCSTMTTDNDYDDGRGGSSHGARWDKAGRRSGAPMQQNGVGLADSGLGATMMAAQLGMDAEVVAAKDKYSPDYLNHYVRIPGTSRDVARDVSRWSRDSSMTIGEERGRAIMRKMSEEMIVSRRYRWDDTMHRPRVDRSAGGLFIPGLIYSRTAVFVALDLFTCTDPLSVAIEFTRSKLTPEPRKYLRAMAYSSEHPQLLDTRVVGPGLGSRHRVVDHAEQVTASTMFSSFTFEKQGRTHADLKTGQKRLYKHYDLMSAEARCRALHLDEKEANSVDGVCSFAPYERTARESHVRSITCQYPQDLPTIDNDHEPAYETDGENDEDDEARRVYRSRRATDANQGGRRPKRPMVLGFGDESKRRAVETAPGADEEKRRVHEVVQRIEAGQYTREPELVHMMRTVMADYRDKNFSLLNE